MRHFCLLALAASLTVAAENVTPRIGLIEIYGDHKVSENKIRAALAAKVGDPLPSRQDAEARIDKVPGVLVSRVEAA